MAQAGERPGDEDPLARPLAMLRARRGRTMTPFDGNLGGLAGDPWLALPDPVSPTRLEVYGVCGFRFLLGSLLRVRAPEDPRLPETMDPLVRGDVVHRTLHDFIEWAIAQGRPAVGEAWGPRDEERAMALLDSHLTAARRRGRAGVAVLAGNQERQMRADLRLFLREDSALRRATGAVPRELEKRIDVTVEGHRLVGYADRIDVTPAGDRAWVLDYKTGRADEGVTDDNPFADGTRLQLPVYLMGVAGVAEARAIYWFITSRAEFKQVGYTDSPGARELFARVLAAVADAVGAGAFPAVPGEWNDFYGEFENCGYCDFTRICSRRRDLELRDKGGDPAQGRWARIAAVARREAE
jgi:RecB family exonuclease